MTPIRLLFLCILLLGIGGGLWWLASTQGEPEPLVPLPEAQEGALLPGDPQQLRRLTIEQPRYGSSIVLGMDEGTWQILEPIRDQPEPFALEGAFRVLFGTDWKEAPESWDQQSDADLGLDPAALLVEATFADGTTSLLQVGAEEQTGNWRVAKRNGQLLRFPIPGFRQIGRPLAQWRDHRLHSLGQGVSRMRWEPAEGEPLEVHRTGNGWNLTEPVKAPFEEKAMPFLLTLLGGRLDGITEDPAPDFPEQDLRGILTLMKGEQEVVLKLYPSGVVSSERDYLLSNDPHNFRLLEMPLEDLISRRMLQLNGERIASIRIRSGEDQAVFRRAPGGWTLPEKEIEQKSSAFVAAMLDYGQTLERGEEVDLPEGPPQGSVVYSISRTPAEKGSQGLRWWVDAQGRNLVSTLDGDRAYVSSINFALGVRSLFEEMPEAWQ